MAGRPRTGPLLSSHVPYRFHPGQWRKTVSDRGEDDEAGERTPSFAGAALTPAGSARAEIVTGLIFPLLKLRCSGAK
jgi:hypothetical protein